VVDLTADTPPPTPPTTPADNDAILISAFERKFGIRLDKSEVSGADLIDLAASLSSHTMKSFQDGSVNSANLSQPNSRSTVSMMVTVGVVLRKEKSKIAENGRAFFTFCLGTLSDGPAIEVLFFDRCYSAYFHQCVPGKVIALVKPNLLSQRHGLCTRFVVSEQCQVQIVAESKDYAECPYIVDSRLYQILQDTIRQTTRSILPTMRWSRQAIEQPKHSCQKEPHVQSDYSCSQTKLQQQQIDATAIELCASAT
jgi:hypothetical protein